MRYLLLLALLTSCRQAPTQAVVEAAWPPPADAFDLPAAATLAVAVSPADIASPATAP